MVTEIYPMLPLPFGYVQKEKLPIFFLKKYQEASSCNMMRQTLLFIDSIVIF